MSTTPKKNIFEILDRMDRRILYLVLIVTVSVPLFFPREIQNEPELPSIDLYRTLMTAPQDKPVVISSDWTLSTRGENAGHTEALLRILMRRDMRFIIFSAADPNAIEVARDVILRINQERIDEGERPYVQWIDYLDLGFFPDLDAHATTMRENIRRAFDVRRPDDNNVPRSALESPVMDGVNSITDIGLLVNVTASNTIDIFVQRLGSGPGRIPIAIMCTGVSGPQVLPFWTSGQVSGLGIGLRGVYDVEYMMEYGINLDSPNTVRDRRPEFANIQVPNFPGQRNLDRAQAYFLALHFALGLLIFAVIVGNVGMYVNRARKKGGRN